MSTHYWSTSSRPLSDRTLETFQQWEQQQQQQQQQQFESSYALTHREPQQQTTRYQQKQPMTTRRRASYTPIPISHDITTAHRIMTHQFSKSASFPIHEYQPPTLNQIQNDDQLLSKTLYTSRIESKATQRYYESFNQQKKPENVVKHLSTGPRVTIHEPIRHTLVKATMERKHRGTSRNILGGFYTS